MFPDTRAGTVGWRFCRRASCLRANVKRVGLCELPGLAAWAGGSSGARLNSNLFLEPISQTVLLDLQVVVRLQIQPESLRRPEVPR